MNELIVRIAARGDGVTESGRHVPFGVTGDAVLDDGALAFGPHHQEPPCRHFPECGGCQLQHADDEAYRGYLVSRVETALAQHDLQTEIRPPHLSPRRSRRRAALKALKVGQSVLLGFNVEMSHRIVDMDECHILRPELFDLVDPLRKLLAEILTPKRVAEVQLTLIDQGADVLLKGVYAGRLSEIELLTSFAMDHELARLSVDRSLGPETLYEPQPASVTLSGMPVAFPVGSFLQATADGEAALVASVEEAVAASKDVADLFAGLGTFALAARGELRGRGVTRRGCGAEAGSADDERRAPRPLSPAARFQGAEAVRSRDPRSAAGGSGRAGCRTGRIIGSARRLCQLQSRNVRARCEDAGRRRLFARLGQPGGPISMVNPRRAGGLLQWP